MIDQPTILEAGNLDEATDMRIAMEVGDALMKHYPNHPWVVCFQARGIIVRHLAIADAVAYKTGRSGFASLLPREKLDRHKNIQQTAVQFGGQLLEAFGLPRGSWDGTPPVCPDWKRGKTKDFT